MAYLRDQRVEAKKLQEEAGKGGKGDKGLMGLPQPVFKGLAAVLAPFADTKKGEPRFYYVPTTPAAVDASAKVQTIKTCITYDAKLGFTVLQEGAADNVATVFSVNDSGDVVCFDDNADFRGIFGDFDFDKARPFKVAFSQTDDPKAYGEHQAQIIVDELVVNSRKKSFISRRQSAGNVNR